MESYHLPPRHAEPKLETQQLHPNSCVAVRIKALPGHEFSVLPVGPIAWTLMLVHILGNVTPPSGRAIVCKLLSPLHYERDQLFLLLKWKSESLCSRYFNFYNVIIYIYIVRMYNTIWCGIM